MSYDRFGNDSYNYQSSSGSPWSQSVNRGGRNEGSNRGWPQNSYSGGYGGSGNGGMGLGESGGGSSSNPEMQMLLSQVQQLQQKVLELSNKKSAGENFGGGGGGSLMMDDDPMSFERNKMSKPKPIAPNGERRILLVSNLPLSLATCDSVYFMFERFGTVERVKILRNQRTSALVQMSLPDEAEKAVQDQEMLKKTAGDIFVNFSTNVNIVKMPSDNGLPNDGLTRDYTGTETSVQESSRPNSMFQGGGSLLGAHPLMGPLFNDAMMHNRMNRGGGGHNMESSASNGPCILVSSLPEEIANPDSLCNLFGFYGDVLRVKILHNKRDCALIQLNKPHQATVCRNFLDQAKVYGKKICVSFSRMNSVKLPSDIGINDDSSTKDYTNVRGVHRFRNPNIAQKLIKNLCAPTAVLHVANLPEEFGKDELREYITDHGFTVKDVHDCGKDGSMALVQMASVEESIATLAKLHNKSSPDIKTKNSSGLCFSFSNRRLNE